jgi:hypothetical protein
LFASCAAVSRKSFATAPELARLRTISNSQWPQFLSRPSLTPTIQSGWLNTSLNVTLIGHGGSIPGGSFWAVTWLYINSSGRSAHKIFSAIRTK